MYFLNILLIAILFFGESCCISQSASNPHKTEVIDLRFRQFTHADTFLRNPFWYMTERIWRKDSFVIEQVRYIKIDSDSKGDTTTFPVLLYRFTDLNTAARYEFKSFSDTATLIRKFRQHDTSHTVGGWGFYKDRDMVGEGQIHYLPDTVVEGKNHHHALISRQMNKIDYILDAWFLPYKKVTRFSLDEGTYSKTGKPMVGYHIYPQGKRGLKAVIEVSFIADTLTSAEEKVFTAWEKYAREHPVQQ